MQDIASAYVATTTPRLSTYYPSTMHSECRKWMVSKQVGTGQCYCESDRCSGTSTLHRPAHHQGRVNGLKASWDYPSHHFTTITSPHYTTPSGHSYLSSPSVILGSCSPMIGKAHPSMRGSWQCPVQPKTKLIIKNSLITGHAHGWGVFSILDQTCQPLSSLATTTSHSQGGRE